MLSGVRLCKFGAEQKNLSRIVNPQKNDQQRPGGAIARGDAAAPDVEANQRFPQHEQYAVAMAPTPTSRQEIGLSGRTL